MCVVEGGMWKPTPSKIYQKHSFLRYPGIWVSVFTNYSTTGTCVLVLVPPFPFPVNDWVVHVVCVCVCAHTYLCTCMMSPRFVVSSGCTVTVVCSP